MDLIRHGARNDTVRAIQTMLNTILTPAPLLVEDGIFGDKTHLATATFQQRNFLVADGIVGPKTAEVLLEKAAAHVI